MYSTTVEKLIKLFSKFPTVGPRTAARFVFYLINSPKQEVAELIKSIEELKNQTKICFLCFKSFEGEGEFCPICSNTSRDKTVLCLVEKEMDLEAIEKTGQFKGLYFILGGLVAVSDEKKKQKIEERINKLAERIKKDGIQEIILALNPTTEGQTTALWLRRRLEPLKIRTSPSARTLNASHSLKITQLGLGLPVGGELEYADEETLASALQGRS